ncbi:MAG: S26 family signal peptidase [Candidatus Limnocylindrales bacterium]
MTDQSVTSDAGGKSSGVSVSASAGAHERWWQRARDGIWRVAVAEESMAPALKAGDWLMLDPTYRRWPRRGSVVVFREPETGLLAIKRLSAGPGDRVRISAGILHLGPDEAWLLGDNRAVSVDSRRYGPVPVEALVGRAWFRYAPLSRFGPIPGRGDLRPGR